MFMKSLSSLFPCCASLVLLFCPANAKPQMLAATQNGSRIDVTVGREFFTSYRFAADEKYPFFYPVNGPSGASVTSMRNGQFPHHSSLFFGLDKVNGGNYWQAGLEKGRILSEGPKIVQSCGEEIVITDNCVWERPGDRPIRDERRIVIRAPTPKLRVIDFSITLEALEDVQILKTNHSLFSARMDPDLTPAYGGELMNAEGARNEKETFGQASPWLASFGSRGRTIEGLAILQHPTNPHYPARWFTRDYGFISPTPMFWPEDGRSTHLEKGATLSLRYRVLVFSGKPDIAALFTEFSEQ